MSFLTRFFRGVPADVDEALSRLSDAEKSEYYQLYFKYISAKNAIDSLRQFRDQQDPAVKTQNANFIKKFMIRLQEEAEKARKAKANFEAENMSGLGAFSVSDAASGVSAALTAVKAIATAALTFVNVAEPILGITLPKETKAAFERTTESTDPATATGPAFSNVPSQYYQSLFTTEALAYITMSEYAEDDTDSKAFSMRDISIIHFFKKTENNVLPARMAAAPSGNIVCTAQSKDDISEIIKTSEDSMQQVVLWKDGTKLTWFLVEHTFKNSADASASKTAMITATMAWNRIAPGGVTFLEATSEETAAFTVAYGGLAGAREATGFFPGEYSKGYSDLTIHAAALAEGNRGNLSYTLVHQLGHILGFRHFYIVDQERTRKLGNSDVQPNPISVMSLQHPSRITFSDIIASRDIYAKYTGDGIYELGKSENGKMLRFQTKRVETGVQMQNGEQGKTNGYSNHQQCYCCSSMQHSKTQDRAVYSVM